MCKEVIGLVFVTIESDRHRFIFQDFIRILLNGFISTRPEILGKFKIYQTLATGHYHSFFTSLMGQFVWSDDSRLLIYLIIFSFFMTGKYQNKERLEAIISVNKQDHTKIYIRILPHIIFCCSYSFWSFAKLNSQLITIKARK